MNVYYKEPDDVNQKCYGVRTDVNGNTIWIDWLAWIHAKEIDSKRKLKALPPEISKYADKWKQDMLYKEKEEGYLPYPIKLVSIHFIYDDKIYKITPDAFDVHRDFFSRASKIIEQDLKDAGCIFTFYNDFLD